MGNIIYKLALVAAAINKIVLSKVFTSVVEVTLVNLSILVLYKAVFTMKKTISKCSLVVKILIHQFSTPFIFIIQKKSYILPFLSFFELLFSKTVSFIIPPFPVICSFSILVTTFSMCFSISNLSLVKATCANESAISRHHIVFPRALVIASVTKYKSALSMPHVSLVLTKVHSIVIFIRSIVIFIRVFSWEWP